MVPLSPKQTSDLSLNLFYEHPNHHFFTGTRVVSKQEYHLPDAGHLSQSVLSLSVQHPPNGGVLTCHRNPVYAPQSLLLTCSTDSLSGDVEPRWQQMYRPHRPDVLATMGQVGGIPKAPLATTEDLSPCPTGRRALSDVQSLVCDRRSLLSREVVPDGRDIKPSGKGGKGLSGRGSWNEVGQGPANGSQPVVVLYRPCTSQYGSVMTSLSDMMTSARPPQVMTRTRHARDSRFVSCAKSATVPGSAPATELMPFVSEEQPPLVAKLYGLAKRPPSFIRAVEQSDELEAILKADVNRSQQRLSEASSPTATEEELQKILEISV